MNIKRTIDIKNSKYEITDLNREQFSKIISAYRHYLYYTCHSLPEGDELLNKLEKMVEADSLIL